MKLAVVSVQFALCVLYSLGSCVAIEIVNQAKSYVLALLGDYNGVFKAFDRNGDGKLTKEEFATGMRSIEEDMTDSEIGVIFTFADKNGDGMIDYSEFLKSSAEMVDDTLKEMFSFFDKDSDGLISSTELRDAIRSVEEDLSDEEIEAIAQEADCNIDGLLDYDEFVAAIAKNSSFTAADTH